MPGWRLTWLLVRPARRLRPVLCWLLSRGVNLPLDPAVTMEGAPALQTTITSSNGEASTLKVPPHGRLLGLSCCGKSV